MVAEQIAASLPIQETIAFRYAEEGKTSDLRLEKAVEATVTQQATKLREAAAAEGESANVRALSAVIHGQRQISRLFARWIQPHVGEERFWAPAIARMDELVQTFEGGAKRLSAEKQTESEVASNSAAEESESARVAAIVAGAVATLLALITAFYAFRLIGRLFGRIEAQVRGIAEQRAQLEKIRDSAGNLTEVANEMLARPPRSRPRPASSRRR